MKCVSMLQLLPRKDDCGVLHPLGLGVPEVIPLGTLPLGKDQVWIYQVLSIPANTIKYVNFSAAWPIWSKHANYVDENLHQSGLIR